MIDYQFYFEAKTGAGDEIVVCRMVYEVDDEGPFAHHLESIIFEGKEVIALLSQEQYDQLESYGKERLKKSRYEEEHSYE